MSETPSTVASQLTEEDVGISEYLGNARGFFGIIKQRFSDFLVNEISTEGVELHLTDLKCCPKLPDISSNGESGEVDRPSEISSEVIAGIEALLASRGTDSVADPVMVPVSDASKKGRTAIHNFINKAYKNLISSTVDQDGQKFIKIMLGSEQSLKYDKKRRTPQHLRQCLRFLLYKENMDTMEAVSKLAARLRIPAHKICYAGTKDKRAKTVQLMSVSDIAPERLMKAVQTIPRMKVGNFHYHPHPLALGQLSGNTFTIVLREVEGDDSDISAAVETLRRVGAINYYGMQRFGSRPGHTHVVGRCLLLRQWDKAVETILMPDPGNFEKSEVLRDFNAKKISAAEAVKRLEECRGKGIEHTLLKGLAELGESDMLGAINRLTRNIRNLYVHAYQSYLWNSVVSRRISKYGVAVLPGDLVSAGPNQTPGDEVEVAVSAEQHEALAVEAANKKLVRRLEDGEVASTAISQVVIPGLGHAVMMPDNEVAKWYEELLAADGLTMAAFGSASKHGVCGCYRAMIVTPQHLTHRVCSYTDPLQSLVPSDLDLIEVSSRNADNSSNEVKMLSQSEAFSKTRDDVDTKSCTAEEAFAKTSEANGATGCESVCARTCPAEATIADKNTDGAGLPGAPDRPQKAVVLQFALPSAAYATMVLRQLLKMPTSSQFHASLGCRKPASGLKRPASEVPDRDEKSQDKTSVVQDSDANLQNGCTPVKKFKASDSDAL